PEMLGEVVEGATGKNRQLARFSAQHAGSRRDRAVAAGDENPPCSALERATHARRELVRWDPLDAKAAISSERLTGVVRGARFGIHECRYLDARHALRPASIVSSSTVALRSSFPQPTTWPRTAAANDFTTTQYMICRYAKRCTKNN